MSETDKTESKPGKGLLVWLWRSFLKKYAWLLLISIFFMAIEGSMLGALSYMMKPMFDNVFATGNTGALWTVGLIFLGIFCTRGLSGLVQKVTMSHIAQNTAADVRRKLLERMMIQDNSFHQTHPPGYLIQRVQTDVQSINNVWSAVITGAGRDTISLIALLGVAISIDWKWTVVALIGTPILILPTVAAQRFVRRRAREARDLGATLATRLDEVFHGIIPVKLNRLEDYQSNRFNEITNTYVKTEVRVMAGSATITAMADVMAGLGFLAVLIFGGGEIISGEKTVGQFMSFFTAIGFAFEPLRRLGAISGIWQVAASGIERIKELIESEPTLVSPKNPMPAPQDTPEIRLEATKLAYGDAKVLRGATFTAEAGKTTAIVGASGAGKSTVFNLLTRLVDPQSGRVTIGGVPTGAMRLEDLRDMFSVVSQEALLFDETVRENIVLGRTDVSEAKLKSALDAAHVTDFLKKLPQGLDTPVGPRGTNLSGGQRQRVVIARALLRNTPILLLDEATSALDAQSETVVQEALDKLAKGRTTLVIAHRLSTVREADKIVVMDKGQVVDEGTHDELIARGGIYASLYNMQFNTDGMTAEERAMKNAIVTEPATDTAPRSWFGRILGRLVG
ncbi:ABC transporter ATP-binding protein/permease [Shimia sp. CNT1-13L.2]|uniref:ABC transporter ATP-binding protein n=1 Tax=Shimia sp. CNT1-13L.2 TaxID=2959663 RepID=UPI0020CC4AD9|nr:ABC transporter ATP-binding protein/permease [Shimia sp. CNT1-13L.2]